MNDVYLGWTYVSKWSTMVWVIYFGITRKKLEKVELVDKDYAIFSLTSA